MASQRKRLERALRGCAEAGVPDTMDLWPAVKERATSERVGAEPADQEGGPAASHRWSRVPRLVPNTPLGWALAAVSVLILGFGVYAAAEPAREFYRQGLPGTVGTGSEREDRGGAADEDAVSTRLFQEALPGDEDLSQAEYVDQTVNRDGASVTLEWAYADTDSVVLGFSVRDLQENRRNAGNRATLEPIFVNKEDEDVPSAPDRRSELTDEAGRYFGSIDGTMMVASPGASPEEIRAPKAQTAVFKTPDGLEASGSHGFRFDVFLDEVAVPSSMAEAEEGYRSEPRPPIGPLTFDFEMPVRPVPVVEVDQEVTVDGITLTLERVINSGSRPEAEICIDPPDEDHLWHPSMAQVGYASDEPPSPRAIGNGCWSMVLGDPVSGRSTVTVTQIWGIPRTEEASREDEDGPQIRGPWTFEFDAPAR